MTLTKYIMAALALVACGGDAEKQAQTLPTIDDLAIGTCGAPAEEGGFVREFAVAPCDGPHATEIAGRYTLPDAEYPGSSRLRRETQTACIPIFNQYVGRSYWFSDFELRTVSPSPSSWAAGDRVVVCLVVGENGAPLESAARDSND